MKLFFVVLSVVITVMANANATCAQTNASPATLRRAAEDYYKWRNRNYPVSSSDAGLYTWDNKLTDYSPAADHLHHRQVADYAPARQVSRESRQRLPPGPVSRRLN